MLFREEFDTLEDWEPLKFPKIDRMSSYSADPRESGESFVRAESSRSASGMMHKREFDVYEFPGLRWRWKVSNVYERGNAREKSGDDYPMRVYVNFKYDPEDPAVKRTFRHGIARVLYGRYPPYRSINYIWANRRHEERFLTNTYTSDSIMIPLQYGSERTGEWITEDVNVVKDYRSAFGQDPPRLAVLAFMNDSDDTGEAAVSWIDWIEVYGPGADPASPVLRDRSGRTPRDGAGK